MEASIRNAIELNQVAPKSLSAVEIYSCFPFITKMARRVIDWPADRAAMVFGGLTFGGGPIGNYMSHAVASMADKLRADGGTGLLVANSGFATHNHRPIISAEPIAAAEFPRGYDFQAEADPARRFSPDLDREYTGPATIETYTAFYHRNGTARGELS